MKTIAILIFLAAQALATLAATSQQQPGTGQVLTAAEYGPAEAAFREMIGTDTPGLIFHLTYGTNDAALPPEFMRRFQAQNQAIRTGFEGLTVLSNKWVLDQATHRHAIGLEMRELRVAGKTAEARFILLAPFKTIFWRVQLGKEGKQWKVKGRQREWEMCG